MRMSSAPGRGASVQTPSRSARRCLATAAPGFVLSGLGAQEIEPLAPIHAYNLVTAGAGKDGCGRTAPGAPEVYGYLELLGGSTITVVGSVASGSKGEIGSGEPTRRMRAKSNPLKIDGTGQILMKEVSTSANPPNVHIAANGDRGDGRGGFLYAGHHGGIWHTHERDGPEHDLSLHVTQAGSSANGFHDC